MPNPPKVYKTEAIIIRQARLGEADEIITLFTPNLGKLRAVAKGARRPRSKLGGHLEPLTHSALMLAQGQTLDIITQGQTINSFMALRQDLWRTTCALYAAELVDQFTEERAESYPIYKLLLETLGRLEKEPNPELALRHFELRLLDVLGYRPELHTCLRCQKPLEPTTNCFSASGGGVLCPGCSASEPVVRPISVNALKVLRFLQAQDFPAASRLRLEPELAIEVESILREYIRYLLEREVKSVAFMDRLRREKASPV